MLVVLVANGSKFSANSSCRRRARSAQHSTGTELSVGWSGRSNTSTIWANTLVTAPMPIPWPVAARAGCRCRWWLVGMPGYARGTGTSDRIRARSGSVPVRCAEYARADKIRRGTAADRGYASDKRRDSEADRYRSDQTMRRARGCSRMDAGCARATVCALAGAECVARARAPDAAPSESGYVDRIPDGARMDRRWSRARRRAAPVDRRKYQIINTAAIANCKLPAAKLEYSKSNCNCWLQFEILRQYPAQ